MYNGWNRWLNSAEPISHSSSFLICTSHNECGSLGPETGNNSWSTCNDEHCHWRDRDSSSQWIKSALLPLPPALVTRRMTTIKKMTQVSVTWTGVDPVRHSPVFPNRFLPTVLCFTITRKMFMILLSGSSNLSGSSMTGSTWASVCSLALTCRQTECVYLKKEGRARPHRLDKR